MLEIRGTRLKKGNDTVNQYVVYERFSPTKGWPVKTWLIMLLLEILKY